MSRSKSKGGKRKPNKVNTLDKTPSHPKQRSSEFSLKAFDYKIIGAILLFTFLVFFNTTQNEFVNWDDDKNFYENELITTLNKENFIDNTIQIFQTPVIGNYNPLTIWTFLIDQKMYGLDNPSGWHMTNVVLHLLAVLFVFLIGRRLKLDWRAGVLFTLLFAIHPLRVESVAWVTERKDVLFGSFYLIALYNYIRYKQDQNPALIKWIFLFFILSLLSKIQAVSLPLSMIAVDYYLEGKFTRKSIISKWPYFLLSLLVGLIGIYFLKDQGSIENTSTTYEAWQRIFIGSFSYCVYLVKSIVPYRMSPLYPYPNEIPILFYISFAIVPIILYSLYYGIKKGYKAWVFGILFFSVNIVFLLQILGAGQGFLADRFTYIAHLGLYFIFAYYFGKSLDQAKWKNVSIGLSCLVILGFAFMTYQQNQVWKNSGTLWSHVLKYYTNTKLPFGNRANYYRDNGLLDKAMSDYNSAIALGSKGNKPADVAQTYNSRARLYFDNSNNRDTLLLALKDYGKAIELKPTDGEFYTNRGATYARLGDLENALKDLSKGIELKPGHAVGYLNRSLIYKAQNRYDLAVRDLESYLKLNPYNSDIWYEKGRFTQQLNNLPDAIKSYDRAISLNNSNGAYYYVRSRAHFLSGNKSAAINDFNYAKSLNYSPIDPAFQAELFK